MQKTELKLETNPWEFSIFIGEFFRRVMVWWNKKGFYAVCNLQRYIEVQS